MNPKPYIALLPLLVPLLGCSSHSIREGIWELNLHTQDVLTGQPASPRKDKVRVRLDWSAEKSGAEAVEIESLTQGIFMYGYIEDASDGSQNRISIEGNDGYWVFYIRGQVRDEEYVSGDELFARLRADSQTGLHGRWEMRWLGEE